MMELLERYDKRIAAGILARAALALENGENFDAKPIVHNEPELRAALIARARANLGFKPDDLRQEVVARIGSYFDEESDRLIGQPQTAAATARLIERGDFPSDLYNIQIIPNISLFFGKDFEREKALIERTVRIPSREQHFGLSTAPNQPRLISLFAREFVTPFPARNFTMLVAGQRGKMNVLHVHQAWRLYEKQVSVVGATDLIELLRRFAEVYGFDITVGGKTAKFFFTTSGVVPKALTIQTGKPSKKKGEISITRFVQKDDAGNEQAALVLAINLDLYRTTLKHWDCKDIS